MRKRLRVIQDDNYHASRPDAGVAGMPKLNPMSDRDTYHPAAPHQLSLDVLGRAGLSRVLKEDHNLVLRHGGGGR